MRVIIIGSGMSGLTAGGYLTLAGHDVTIFEQFSNIGGVTTTMQQDGFSWDLGPLILEGFGPGDRIYRILDDLGVAEQIPTLLGDRGYVFPDFDLWKPEQYSGPEWRKERLKKLFPDEVGGLNLYYDFYEKMMDVIALNNRVDQSKGLRGFLLKVQLALAYSKVQNKQDWSAQKLMDFYFDDPKLKAVYNSIASKTFLMSPNLLLIMDFESFQRDF